jgi:hypothetical protein
MLSIVLLPFIGVLSLLFIVNVFPVSTARETTTTTASEPFWTKGAPMPTPRTEVAAAISADNIYVIGGFDESGQVTGVVEVYNINNNSWTKAVPLPQSLSEDTHLLGLQLIISSFMILLRTNGKKENQCLLLEEH